MSPKRTPEDYAKVERKGRTPFNDSGAARAIAIDYPSQSNRRLERGWPTYHNCPPPGPMLWRWSSKSVSGFLASAEPTASAFSPVRRFRVGIPDTPANPVLCSSPSLSSCRVYPESPKIKRPFHQGGYSFSLRAQKGCREGRSSLLDVDRTEGPRGRCATCRGYSPQMK
jgi:hypothetical protein